jgi:hypothetical protein
LRVVRLPIGIRDAEGLPLAGLLLAIEVTGLFYFLPLFAETSYVSFVPASDHLDIACLFHD